MRSRSSKKAGAGKWMKGKKLTKEWIENRTKSQSGENHYNWQGGKSFEVYPVDWRESLRKSIRERDKYVCCICNVQQGDIAHDVHHIDYNKKNCNPDNLITICHSCHTKTNFNRQNWCEYFNNIIQKLCEK